MSLLYLILLIALIGFGLWALNTYVPMQAGAKRILNILVIIVLILIVLSAFGLLSGLHSVRVPTL